MNKEFRQKQTLTTKLNNTKILNKKTKNTHNKIKKIKQKVKHSPELDHNLKHWNPKIPVNLHKLFQ